ITMRVRIEVVTNFLVDDGVRRNVGSACADGAKTVHGEEDQHDQHHQRRADGAGTPEKRIFSVHLFPRPEVGSSAAIYALGVSLAWSGSVLIWIKESLRAGALRSRNGDRRGV